jgi:2-methylcitrate dehydratase PrpD
MLRDASATLIIQKSQLTKNTGRPSSGIKKGGNRAMGGASETPVSDITRQLAAYISGAPGRALPQAVVEKTRFHILDTLAAILSGSRLRAGVLAARYVADLDGAGPATVIGSAMRVPPESAALANGMAGHGDETDDSHLEGRFHPGCGILPAALAIAEGQNASGADFVRAIALGYDVGARLTLSLGLLRPDASKHSTHSLAPAFGAAAAGAALFRLSEEQVRHVLSYAAQQASGIPFWQRDTHHVEKAFDFGGMAARNGVASASMVASGFTAVDDPLAGRHNLFTAFGEEADPQLLIEDLGVRFEIMRASIKKWCVGSPIQAILDATTALVAEHAIKASDVMAVTITMPDDRFHIVDNRTMPDICAQHLCALAIIDGGITFESTHDHARMHDSAVLALREKIQLTPDAELTRARPARQAIVEIRTAAGAFRHHARAVRGTPDNPMTAQEIEAKALDLVTPIIGAERGAKLVETVRDLENLPSMRDLRPLLTA